MIHAAVFGYLIVMLVGIICLAISLFLYLKIKSRFLFNFLIYFSAFTFFVFSHLVVLTYINANLTSTDFYVMMLVLAMLILSYSFLLYSILHFGHFLIYEKQSCKRNSFEILFGIIALLGMASSFEIIWSKEQINQLEGFGLYFSNLLLFIVIIYSLILKLIHIKRVEDERKRIMKNTSIMSAVFIPGFVIDFYLLQAGYFFLFVPGFYLCSSILFLRYFVKKHNDDLIMIRSIGDPNLYNDYLTQAGISNREKEIIVLIMQGCSNREIANQLFISLSTVKTHIRNIFKKLDVESRFEIITKLKNPQQN